MAFARHAGCRKRLADASPPDLSQGLRVSPGVWGCDVAAVWNLAAAQAELDIAAERLATAEKLEIDVARRQSGDLARTDLLPGPGRNNWQPRGADGSTNPPTPDVGRLQVPHRAGQACQAPSTKQLSPEGKRHAPTRSARAGISGTVRANLRLQADRRNPPELFHRRRANTRRFRSAELQDRAAGTPVPARHRRAKCPQTAVANSVVIKAEAELQANAQRDRKSSSRVPSCSRKRTVAVPVGSNARHTGGRTALQEKAFSLGELRAWLSSCACAPPPMRHAWINCGPGPPGSCPRPIQSSEGTSAVTIRIHRLTALLCLHVVEPDG